MASLTFNKQLTALLVIDPYNDLISEGGKVWDRLKAVAEANGCVPHMVQVLHAARRAGFRIFYAPHRGTVPETMKLGNMLRQSRRRPGHGGPSNTGHGAVSSEASSPR